MIGSQNQPAPALSFELFPQSAIQWATNVKKIFCKENYSLRAESRTVSVHDKNVWHLSRKNA